MRLPLCLMPCVLLVACGKPGELTPPLHAAPPAAVAVDQELAPGARLPDDTRPESYALTLDVDPAKDTYRGSVTIELALARARDSIWLHSRGLRVSKVAVAGNQGELLAGRLEPVGETGLAAIRLTQPVGPGTVRATLTFEGNYGKRLAGLYKAESGGMPYTFTQFEPISAREAFPCLDEPRFKAPFALTLRVPKGQHAIANTQIESERELAEGLREVRFTRTEKLPTYLIALAVGPFDIVPAPPLAASPLRSREVPLRGVAVRGRGPDLAYALRGTPALLAYLERYFGVGYAYDKLDLIAVPDFGAGAMENAGAITFRDTLLLVRDDAPEQQKRSLSYVNAHELAHQWFGNLVTMPWWDDIWLNEAFATWMGGKAVGVVQPELEPDLGQLTATHNAMDLDSRAAARKIRQPIDSEHDIESAFDQITYAKGGAVLSMFEGYLGAERFQRGLQAYMQRYRFGSATARDLVRTLAETSGESALEPAFFSFLDQPGVPELQVQLDCTNERPSLTLSQARYWPLGALDEKAGSWQLPVCVRYGASDGSAPQQCTLLREAETQLPLEAEGCPRWLMPNADAQGYYRWTMAEPDLTQLLSQRGKLSTRERMSLASNALAGLRAGSVSPRTAITVARALVIDPQRQVVESALRTYALLRELLDPKALPGMRAELSRLLAPAYRKLGLFPRSDAEVRGEEKLWRASVVRALYVLAEDAEVTRALARAGRPLLERPSQPSKLPSELIELALAAAIIEGGAAQFARAEQQLFASQDGVVRGRLLSALGYVRDPALSTRVLALSLDPRLRLNERLLPLVVQSAERRTRHAAFAWLRQRFDVLSAQIGAHGGDDLVATTAGFCSEADAREVEGFFASRAASIAGGPRALALSLESIRVCAALAKARGDALGALYAPTQPMRAQAR